jgi:hypothetical protein
LVTCPSVAEVWKFSVPRQWKLSDCTLLWTHIFILFITCIFKNSCYRLCGERLMKCCITLCLFYLSVIPSHLSFWSSCMCHTWHSVLVLFWSWNNGYIWFVCVEMHYECLVLSIFLLKLTSQICQISLCKLLK